MRGSVHVDEVGITVTIEARTSHIAWPDLIGVAIQTTDAGPLVDDMYYLLGRRDDSVVVVPSEAEGVSVLLERLQTLPASTTGP